MEGNGFKVYTIDEILAMQQPEPQPLDAAALDRLEDLHRRATDAPWEAHEDERVIQYGRGGDWGGFRAAQFFGSDDPDADLRLMAEMRNAISGLLLMARKYLESQGSEA